MDELNRAPKKVRNAVMELIQFKSINGVKFPNLRVVWAAINPQDDDSDLQYDVDSLDPSQDDRFHIYVNMPYEPDKEYFNKNYGESGAGAISWWDKLTKQQQEEITPRRLEYAIQVWAANGNVRHVFRNRQINVNKLIVSLNSGPIEKTLKSLITATDDEKTKAFSDINFTTNAYPLISKNAKYARAYGKFIPKDMLSNTIMENNHAAKNIMENVDNEIVDDIVESIIKSGALNKSKLKKMASTNNIFAKQDRDWETFSIIFLAA